MVQLRRFDAAAEVEQVFERAVAAALVGDRLAGAATDALHRAQAIADRGLVDRFEHEVGRVDVWRQHGQADRSRLVEKHPRSEEQPSELQSLMRISYAVFRLT